MPKLSDFRITKKAVDALPTDKDATYRDADLKGFALRTKPSGSKTYLVIYRNKEGRTRSVALGQHGALTPDMARKKALKVLAEVGDGLDPSEDRAVERKAMTVCDLCEQYLVAAEKGKILGRLGLPKKASTLEIDRGRVSRHIIPLIGKRKVKDLKSSDITKFMWQVAEGETATDIKTGLRGRAIVTGGEGTAKRVVGLLGGIFSFAISMDIIQQNPCRGVVKPADKVRQVRLEVEHYRILADALEKAEAKGEAWQAVVAFRLIALTGCRLNEIGKLKWADVDLAGQALRLTDTKTGKSVRPIGRTAVSILASLNREGPYVFPAVRIENAPFGGLAKAWLRIFIRIEIVPGSPLDGLTPHGFRHGFASIADDLGLTEITIAAIIGHSKTGTTKRYMHKLDSALVAAADRVAARIWSHMTGMNESATVMPVRRA